MIPPDYARSIRSGKPARVLVVDASDATSARVVLSVASGVGVRLSQDLTVRTLARRGERLLPPWPSILALVALGVVVFAAAIVRFQKKLD